jgi:predicted transcriptional regulator
MEPKSLLTYVSNSSVRKGILYKLFENPMALAELREYFCVTSADLIPRLKELEKLNLTSRKDGAYHLTLTGKITVKMLMREDRVSSIIENHGSYLNDHDLEAIPENLLYSLDQLTDCKLVNNEINDINAIQREIFDNLSRSNIINGILPIFDHTYMEFFTSIACKESQLSLILTESVLKKIKEYNENFLNTFLSHNTRLYVISDSRLALYVTDTFLSIALFNKHGEFDAKTNFMSFEKSAQGWGRELFKFYRRQSKEIKKPSYENNREK